jgi:hypothetical protein
LISSTNDPEDMKGPTSKGTWGDNYKLLHPMRFIDELIFLQKEIVGFELKQGLASDANQSPENYEKFVRNLRVSYENDEQIKIQEPGKPSQPYTYASFGFKKPGEIWETFLEILKNQDHSKNIGPAHKISAHIKQKIKDYDQSRGLLKKLSKEPRPQGGALKP